MENSGKQSNPILRLVKTKIVNIVIIGVIIVCIILFMRDSNEDNIQISAVDSRYIPGGVVGVELGHQQNVQNHDTEDDGGEIAGSTTNSIEDELQRKILESQLGDGTTTNMDAISTTPYFTTEASKIHLHKDSEKDAIHISYLAVGGFDIGDLKLDYLSNYRNPCFFEEREVTNVVHVGATYSNNPYSNMEHYKDKFNNLKKLVIRSHEDLCGSSAGCRLRCVPYFMVIGTAESETIDFFDTLVLHSQIVSPVKQELEFWHKYRFGEANFNDYLDLFDNASTNIHKQNITDVTTHEHIYLTVTGEAAPIAMLSDPYWRKRPENEDLEEPKKLIVDELYSVMPNLKLIFMLREPVSHVYWHYNNAPYGKEKKSPEDFHRRVQNSIYWWNSCIAKHPERACVYGSPPDMDTFEERDDNTWWPKTMDFLGAMRDGLYWFYIKDALDVFPKEHCLFVRTHDYMNDPRRILNEQVFPFLDLSPFREQFHVSADAKQLNANMTTDYEPMWRETKSLLSNFYKPYNEKLSNLLRDQRFEWKDIMEAGYAPNVPCC